MNRTTGTTAGTFFYAPATDTIEIPAVRRGAPRTVELHLLDLPPVVPARQPRPGLLRRALARMTGSPSLRESVHAAFWPGVGCAGLLIGAYLVLAFRGLDVTPSTEAIYR